MQSERKRLESELEGLKEELLTCPNPMSKHDIREEIKLVERRLFLLGE